MPRQEAPSGVTYGATPTATPMQAAPGSAALAQALRTDAGAPIFGTSGDEKGKKPGAWNVESLRYMG